MAQLEINRQNSGSVLVLEFVYSPDDGGWYVETVDEKTGATVHTTTVHLRRADADREARSWRNDAELML